MGAITNAACAVGLVGLTAVSGQHRSAAQTTREPDLQTVKNTGTVEIPRSIQVEHQRIHATLVEATKAGGRVGAAAQSLANVLHPHFVREEEIALPPLGLLSRLAKGVTLAAGEVTAVRAMSDALRRELPRMLEEHKAIRAAVENLRAAARAEQATRYEALANDLALHAQTEEEVLYPAAVLVGDILRTRSSSK